MLTIEKGPKGCKPERKIKKSDLVEGRSSGDTYIVTKVYCDDHYDLLRLKDGYACERYAVTSFRLYEPGESVTLIQN